MHIQTGALRRKFSVVSIRHRHVGFVYPRRPTRNTWRGIPVARLTRRFLEVRAA